jgi:hypothetical protein
MVSLVLFTFAVIGVLSVAVSMASAYRDQRQVIAAEATVRNAMDLLTDAVRGAGPAVGGQLEDTITTDPLTGNCSLGTVKVTNREDGPDELEVIYASGAVVTTLRSAYTGAETTLTLVDTTQLEAGDMLLIAADDNSQGHLVHVTDVNPPQVTIEPLGCTPTNAITYGNGALVIRAMRARFQIGAFDGQPDVLLMLPNNEPLAAEPLAEHVEDLQVALGYDAGSGLVEWAHTATTGDPPLGPLTVRAVRITLVVRAESAVGGPASYLRPAAEDRPAATDPDRFRRRVLTSTVEIRNSRGSP